MTYVLVLSASYGEGHNAAARGLVAAVEGLEGPHRAELVDLLALTVPRRDRWTRWAYQGIINRVPGVWSAFYGWLHRSKPFPKYIGLFRRQEAFLEKILMERPPIAVCSTYPIFAFMIARIVARRGLSIPSYNVVTDSISINSMWWLSSCDGWFVPNEESAKILREAGCAENALQVLGFPVDPRFTRLERSRPLLDLRSGESPRVLYIINSGSNQAMETVTRLFAQTDWEITIAVGKDEVMRKRIQDLATSRVARTEVLGWTGNMPDLLMSHHVVISKAGGATTQEAIAAHCPMVVNQIIPGQEEGNYELLRRHDIGTRVDGADEIIAALEQAFADNGAIWAGWRKRVVALARPEAAVDIAQYVLNQTRGGVSPPKLTSLHHG